MPILPRLQIQRIDSCNGGAELLQIAADHAERLDQVAVSQPAMRGMNEVGIIHDFPFKLADLVTAGRAGLPFAGDGAKLIYRKIGSHPGGRIDFASAGIVAALYPGCVIDAPVKGGTLFPGIGCPSAGWAVLTVVKLPGYNFIEPRFSQSPQQSANQWLTGEPTASVLGGDAIIPTFSAAVAANTDPPIINTFSFPINGLSAITVLIQANGGALTSFDLVPWFAPTTSQSGLYPYWFEQGTERITVPDSDTTGQQYRVVTMKLNGAMGSMSFSPRNVLGGATGLKFAVIGI